MNNAGIATGTPLIAGPLDAVRLEMDTNFFGPLAVTRAFAPVIESNGGRSRSQRPVGPVLAASGRPRSYAAAKAAAWALTGAAGRN